MCDYPKAAEKYFDFVTKRAVLDRFPAFRFNGTMKEDFNSIKEINVSEFVEDNKKSYESLIRSFTFYKNNYMKEMHGWKCKNNFERRIDKYGTH